MSAPAPFSFELTDDEARIAASRAALRLALSGGLLGRHVAPLAAFLLVLTFAGILGFTDLMSRRAAEVVILLAAAAFMLQRLGTRRRFLQARRAARDWSKRLKTAGPLTISFDATGARLTARDLDACWPFAEADDIEDAGGMIYLWPKAGDPLFWPTRAFAAESDAAALIVFVRAHGVRAHRVAAAVEDDDD